VTELGLTKSVTVHDADGTSPQPRHGRPSAPPGSVGLLRQQQLLTALRL